MSVSYGVLKINFSIHTSLFSVPNKAFARHTWVNDKRHSWKQWRYGHSSLAVDGLSTDNNLPNCAIMDNYYVDAPVWRVDLGKQTKVAGVVVTTWQGLGQGEAEMNHHRNVGIELVGKHGRNLKVKLEKKPAIETQGCPLAETA